MSIFNPIDRTSWHLGKDPWHKWMAGFLERLKQKRKVALRLGKISATNSYTLSYAKIKDLANKKIKWQDIKASDLTLSIEQKEVDMKIGVDIASLAFKKQVDQIILITGDSDFVPAAKLARRKGIDFILDPMEFPISEDLFEHIDGLQSLTKKFARKEALKGEPAKKVKTTKKKRESKVNKNQMLLNPNKHGSIP